MKLSFLARNKWDKGVFSSPILLKGGEARWMIICKLRDVTGQRLQRYAVKSTAIDWKPHSFVWCIECFKWHCPNWILTSLLLQKKQIKHFVDSEGGPLYPRRRAPTASQCRNSFFAAFVDWIARNLRNGFSTTTQFPVYGASSFAPVRFVRNRDL